MRVLVTGATGYLGSAVAQRLLTARHEVVGLARNNSGLRALAAAGLTPLLGDLTDRDSLETAIKGADAVIETANADNAESAAILLDILAGSGKRFIRTSGVGIYTELSGGEPSSTVHVEDPDFVPLPQLTHRYEIDRKVLAAAGNGDHTVVLRPGMVYGQGGSEQLPVLLRAALRDGVSRYTGRGLNRYPNVYLDDVAQAYLLALESAPSGSQYNLATDEAEMRQIADGIARLLHQDGAKSVTFDEMAEAIGTLYALGMSCNVRVNPARAYDELGWKPQGPSLLDDLVHGSYRRVWGPREVALVTEEKAA